MKKQLPINLIKVKKTVSLPVYSSIKIVNGHLVGELENYIETPLELLSKEDGGNERFN